MTTGYLNTSYIKVYIEKTSNKIKHLFTGFPPRTGAGAGVGARWRVQRWRLYVGNKKKDSVLIRNPVTLD